LLTRFLRRPFLIFFLGIEIPSPFKNFEGAGWVSPGDDFSLVFSTPVSVLPGTSKSRQPPRDCALWRYAVGSFPFRTFFSFDETLTLIPDTSSFGSSLPPGNARHPSDGDARRSPSPPPPFPIEPERNFLSPLFYLISFSFAAFHFIRRHERASARCRLLLSPPPFSRRSFLLPILPLLLSGPALYFPSCVPFRLQQKKLRQPFSLPPFSLSLSIAVAMIVGSHRGEFPHV